MWVLAITGALIGLSFAGMALLQSLGQNPVPSLALYGLACVAYGLAVWWTLRRPEERKTLVLILGLALLFRATTLLTTPITLSDDVYRYIWDGRLMNAGVNPYAYRVDSPHLDPFATPLRGLVNHHDMASPYLPAAQALFAVVYRLSPESPLAFQVTAALLDLLTGFIVLDLLRRFGLPASRALIYLWHPLVVVEFAHGAHVDAWMLFLMLAAFWLSVAVRSRLPSVAALAAATLTKGLPLLLLPLLARRWRAYHLVIYLALFVAACLPFVPGAGWGLTGPPAGTGLFGALRIYAASWHFNGGLYHWLEAALSNLWAPGTVAQPALAARLIATTALGLAVIAAWRAGQECQDDLALLRWMTVPLAAYLLLATTVHPWYVTVLVPLLPFLPGEPGQVARSGRFLWAWLYFSAAVSLSYLTYLDPANLREYDLVRVVEYAPLYLLLIWAAWPAGTGRRAESA